MTNSSSDLVRYIIPSTIPITLGTIAKNSAGQNRYEKHDDSFGRVAQHELVNTEGANHYPKDSSQDLLVSAHGLPVSYCSWRSLVYRLHRLITTTNRTQRSLTGCAVLRSVIVYSAAFCTISTH